MSYGHNYGEMQGIIKEQDEMSAGRRLVSEAKRNVAALGGIRRHLTTVHSAMRPDGSKFHPALRRLPCALLTVEEQRCDALYKAGHRLVRKYTRTNGAAIYRYPVLAAKERR